MLKAKSDMPAGLEVLQGWQSVRQDECNVLAAVVSCVWLQDVCQMAAMLLLPLIQCHSQLLIKCGSKHPHGVAAKLYAMCQAAAQVIMNQSNHRSCCKRRGNTCLLRAAIHDQRRPLRQVTLPAK